MHAGACKQSGWLRFAQGSMASEVRDRYDTIATPTREGRMASDGEYRAAIAKVRHAPKDASKGEWDLVERAAKQAGELGNAARAALAGR